MKLENIKAIFFDADDTIVDHKQCEKEALIYLFDKKDYQITNSKISKTYKN